MVMKFRKIGNTCDRLLLIQEGRNKMLCTDFNQISESGLFKKVLEKKLAG